MKFHPDYQLDMSQCPVVERAINGGAVCKSGTGHPPSKHYFPAHISRTQDRTSRRSGGLITVFRALHR